MYYFQHSTTVDKQIKTDIYHGLTLALCITTVGHQAHEIDSVSSCLFLLSSSTHLIHSSSNRLVKVSCSASTSYKIFMQT